MALLDRLRDATVKQDPVKMKLDRGRERLSSLAPERRVFWRFYRDEPYCYIDDKGVLQTQATESYVRGGKPPHRVRMKRNLIMGVVRQELSYANQRTPSFEASPSTSDPEDVGAAKLAEKVALFGYDEWGFANMRREVTTHALVGDEGFVWPIWNPDKGPFIPDVDPETGEPATDEKGKPKFVGRGEVKLLVFGSNTCFWEPGLRFEDSPWHAVSRAMPVEEAERQPGFIGAGGKFRLTPDVNADETGLERGKKEQQAKNLVLVEDYLERPCPEYPLGRWLTYANGRQIYPERTYPGASEGIDLCLHKLSYLPDPDSDRDLGLVRFLVDAQRTYLDCVNKLLEAKNRGLNLQMLAPRGASLTRRTDEPGTVTSYNLVGGVKPEWEPPPPPGLFAHLFQIAEQAKADIAALSAQNDIPSGVEAARAIAVLIEKDQSARQLFIDSLADLMSRVMRHCLVLVQKHYTEDRLLKVKGRFGTESIKDFRGAQLRGQVDVRVPVASIEPRTRQAIEQKVQNLYQMGLITPQQALVGMNGGTGESIVNSYELDVSRAHLMIQKIREGWQAFLTMPKRFDPRFISPENPQGEVPGWMPRDQDNAHVHMQIVGDYMKTPDFDAHDPVTQDAFQIYYDGCKELIALEAHRAAAAQAQQAAAQGMSHAAAPQAKPMPSQPALDPGAGQ